ncbi:MAG: thiamine phosphate synthase [Alistipes sp.]|nr:thiamine phosphate synthase [Alistipes sp.]
MMRLLFITGEACFPTEAAAIRLLLAEGIDRVHLRKPEASEAELRRLIEALPPACYPPLSLHDRLPLAAEYGLGGVHLNRRNPTAPEGFGGLRSRSCHTLDELAAHRDDDYLLLSPIFDSISKQNYRSGHTPEELRDAAARGLLGPRTIALGGVTPDRLPLLAAYGFGGAALSGYLRQAPTTDDLRRRMAELRKFNP